MKTNSDKRNTSKRCQSTYQIKTRLRNGGRIAGMGILYDDYSEEAFPSVNTDPRYCPDPKLGIPLTEEEKKFRDEGGPVITYQIKEDKP
jgi:hypothetical protein